MRFASKSPVLNQRLPTNREEDAHLWGPYATWEGQFEEENHCRNIQDRAARLYFHSGIFGGTDDGEM